MDIADMSEDRIEFERVLGVASVKESLQKNDQQVVVMSEDGAPMIVCTDCNLPIPVERLEAKPNASRCIYCQTMFERGMN